MLGICAVVDEKILSRRETQCLVNSFWKHYHGDCCGTKNHIVGRNTGIWKIMMNITLTLKLETYMNGFGN